MKSKAAAWLSEQKHAIGAVRPNFEGILLGRSPWSYVARRLRPYAGLQTYAAALQIAEYLFFFSIFAPRFTGMALAAVNLGILTQGAIAGSLEVERRLLRSTKGRKRRSALSSTWFTGYAALSVAIGLPAVVLAIVMAFSDTPTPSQGIIAAVLLRVALDCFGRAYHAGVFAFHRVYRPTVAALVVESTTFVATLGLARFLGPWAFPAALAASALVGSIVTIYYAGKSYDRFRLARPRLVSLSQPRWLTVRGLAAFGLAGAAQKTGAVLITWFALSADTTSFPILLHVVSPFLVIASNWTQVFAFDLARWGQSAAAPLVARFERPMVRLALAVGLAMGIVAIIVSRAVFGDAATLLAAALLPMFLARSLMSLRQVQIVLQGRVGAALAPMVAMIVVSLGAQHIGWPTSDAGMIVAMAIAMALGAIAAGPRATLRAHPPTIESSLTEWLDFLRDGRLPRFPLRLIHAQFTRTKAAPHVVRSLADELADKEDAHLPIRIGRQHLAWLEDAASTDDRVELVTKSLGTLELLRRSQPLGDRESLLAAAKGLAAPFAQPPLQEIGVLSGALRDPKTLNPRDARPVLFAAERAARSGRPERVRGTDLRVVVTRRDGLIDQVEIFGP